MKLFSTLLFACVLGVALFAGPVMADPSVFPNGTPEYGVDEILNSFKENEYAAASMKGNPVVIVGLIDRVKYGNYSENPEDLMSDTTKAPMAIIYSGDRRLGFLGAYFLNDPVDPAILTPGDGALLLCEDVKKGPMGLGLQAKCLVIGSGPVDENGQVQPNYFNNELYKILQTPKKP